jgi:2-dehydropantoate 2-reductase
MRILIVGAGAIGSFLGARLALGGHDVVLVGRRQFLEAVRADGLTLIQPDGTFRADRIAVVESISGAFPFHSPFDLALVTVKAYDTSAVVAELEAAANGPRPKGAGHLLPPLLTLQNGLGNEELLAEAFGADQVIAGAIDTPVSVPAPGHVLVHRPTYRIGLAAVGRSAPVGTAAAVLGSAGFGISSYSDYRGLKWSKLLMNILANASCAILDWTPALVMADPVMAVLEARAWKETMAVMARLDIGPVRLGGYPFPQILPIARRLPAGLLALGMRSFVSGGRGSKMPSLQIALSTGRASEVAWLNGAVARHAREVGLPAPVNRCLADLLTSISVGHTDWNEYRGRPDRLSALIAYAAR